MANALTYLVCPYKVAMHLNGDSDCHILVVLSQLPLTIFELGNMANEVTLKLCPIKVVIKLYGGSDCHIPILPFELPLTIFELGNQIPLFLVYKKLKNETKFCFLSIIRFFFWIFFYYFEDLFLIIKLFFFTKKFCLFLNRCTNARMVIYIHY